MVKRSVVVAGPLGRYGPEFREHLTERGYSLGGVAAQFALMHHVSCWLDERRLAIEEFDAVRVEEFLHARRSGGWTKLISVAALSSLAEFLLVAADVRIGAAMVSVTDVDRLLDDYRVYLIEERGLVECSRRNYLAVARLFLDHRVGSVGGLALDGLSTAVVTEFVLRECHRCSVVSAKCLSTRLRSFLRFLFVDGRVTNNVADAVPAVSGWRLARLPRAIPMDSVALLLASCDRRTDVGRRDFAVLTMLSRLGLRAGEIAGLKIDDVDWRHGELVVVGKANRRERLPLPVDVGEALVEWLTVRPGVSDCRHVFCRVRAPHGGISAGGVTAIVRHACGRAGLAVIGAHRLRHTAATEMLRVGGSLAEVAQVLRHRSVETTAVYAKVDRLALAALVRPWPGTVR